MYTVLHIFSVGGGGGGHQRSVGFGGGSVSDRAGRRRRLVRLMWGLACDKRPSSNPNAFSVDRPMMSCRGP
jgi:hypothetical protein